MDKLIDAQLGVTEVPNAIFLVLKSAFVYVCVAVHTIFSPDVDVYCTLTVPLGNMLGWYVYVKCIHVPSGASARAHVAP
jgi:hypothetical protein